MKDKDAGKWKKQKILKQAFDELKRETGIDHRKVITGDEKERQRLKMKQYQEKMREELNIEIRKITEVTPILGGKDGMIELNPNNPHHREWHEDDENN